MNRRAVLVVLVVTLFAWSLHLPARAADPPSGSVTLGPLIAGTQSYVNGTFVWTDYVYDDRGGDRDLFAGGDDKYPAEAAPGNTADLVQLQIGYGDRGLWIRSVMNSMVEGSEPIVGVGFDTDDDPTTGARELPGGSWVPSRPLGLEKLVVLSANGGALLTHAEGEWRQDALIESKIDPTTNTLDVAIGRNLLDPGRERWRAYAVAGVESGGSSWLHGGPIFDLAFVEAEDPFTESAYAFVDAAHQTSGQIRGEGADSREWQDHRQADILSGRLDPINASAIIDFDKIRSRRTEIATASTPGFHTFLHETAMTLGEGVQAEPRQYRGRFSPYLVRLPERAGASLPLIVFLHGGHANHLTAANYFEPSRTDEISPGFFDPSAIVIFPLGRDPEWIPATSEVDFLEVLEDVSKRLPVDTDRIVLTGISGGAAGSLRYGQLYPDRWAGIYPLSGGGGPNFFENLDHLPVRIANGLLDPLGGVGNITLTAALLEEVGTVDYEIWLANIRSHVPMPALGDCVLAELISQPRIVDPPRVTYTFDPTLNTVEPEHGINLTYTGAYWVSGLTARPIDGDSGAVFVPGYGATVHLAADPTATIEAVSLARADRQEVGVTSRGAYENATAGRDFCGPNPAVRTGDSWEEQKRKLQPGDPQDTQNGMTLSLRNVETATFDLLRMGLRSDRPVSVDAIGDGPSTIRLQGQWRKAVTVERDGQPFKMLQPTAGAITLTDDFTGGHLYTLKP